MKMQGSARDLFSHMKLLGLAAIVSSYRENDSISSFSPVTVWWEDPGTMVLSSILHDVSVEEAALCVRAYLDDLVRSEQTIRRTVKVGGKEHSPLSPRIAKEFSNQEWVSYQSVRQDIVDQAVSSVPLFADLINALGFPAYWSTTLDGAKGKSKLDLGASLWEMAPRNQGSEFMQNKYLKHISTCEGLSVDEIAARICGNEIDAKREERNASGLHAPAYLDVLLSFVALSGIGLFPTRPITAGEVGSVSTAVTTQRIGGRKQAHFVLPVISHGITLERYKGICRNAAMYRIANGVLRGSQDVALDAQTGASATWLQSHDVGYLAVFRRHVGGSPSCPEYYAREGTIIPV